MAADWKLRLRTLRVVEAGWVHAYAAHTRVTAAAADSEGSLTVIVTLAVTLTVGSTFCRFWRETLARSQAAFLAVATCCRLGCTGWGFSCGS